MLTYNVQAFTSVKSYYCVGNSAAVNLKLMYHDCEIPGMLEAMSVSPSPPNVQRALQQIPRKTPNNADCANNKKKEAWEES